MNNVKNIISVIAVAAFVAFVWYWGFCRFYVAPDEMVVVSAKRGTALPADRILAEPGEKGTASRSGSSDGRFVILELIATGGFAAVYKADSRGQPRPTTLGQRHSPTSANLGQSRA